MHSCDGWVTAVEHVGSTAISGLIARPTVDVLAAVADEGSGGDGDGGGDGEGGGGDGPGGGGEGDGGGGDGGGGGESGGGGDGGGELTTHELSSTVTLESKFVAP